MFNMYYCKYSEMITRYEILHMWYYNIPMHGKTFKWKDELYTSLLAFDG